MILLTDITGIWCYNLIMTNDDTENHMKQKRSRVVDFMFFILIAIYVGSYFLPHHWGVKCSKTAPPLGSAMLGIFYIIWTFYTVCTIRNDPMLKLKEQSWKELYLMAK
jgi:hypothetical protein